MLGQQMTLVAVPFQVYALTGSSLLVGVTSAFVNNTAAVAVFLKRIRTSLNGAQPIVCVRRRKPAPNWF